MKLSKELFCVYGVTDNTPTLESIENAIKGGVKIIQLRMKDADENEFSKTAQRVKKICENKALFIINDNVEIAKLVDADGVHLGQGDMNIKDARKVLENKIIGISAHNKEEAIKAEQDGADYLGSGAMFATDTKNNVTSLSVSGLKEICDSVKIPVVAIGGIKLDNMEKLKGCKADGVAVCGALFKGDAEKNARMLIERWKSL